MIQGMAITLGAGRRGTFELVLSTSGITALELNCRSICNIKLFPGRIQTVFTFSLTTYAFQASGFILDCIGEQDDHAEFITNIRELKDFGLEVPNIGHVKSILLEHHLHRFGLILKNNEVSTVSAELVRWSQNPKQAPVTRAF